ncbi:MAG: hypothetical protein LUE99_06820 [Bacteroides sp.]|nr:hypothetical protein [Bacteroides sp.]
MTPTTPIYLCAGETKNTKVITGNTTLDGITLLRALARIDVGCALSGEIANGLGNFTMKSVTVYRVNNKGYVAPLATSLNTDGSIGVKDVSIPGGSTVQNIPYSVGDGKSLIRTVYVAETAVGTTKDNTVCLIIGGTYSSKTTYYRVDLKTSTGAYVPVKRNCRYVVNITGVSVVGYDNEAEALKGDKSVQINTQVTITDAKTVSATTGPTITL